MFEQRIETFVKQFPGKYFLFEDTNDLYYFSGLRLSSGILIIAEEARGLFVDGRYYEMAKEKSPVEVFAKEIETLKKFLEKHKVLSLIFDSARTPVAIWLERQKTFPIIQWVPEPQLTKKLRGVKSLWEQNKMRASAALTKEAFSFAVNQLREGITEKQIAWGFEKYCRERGAEKMAFDPIVAFAEHSACPHHRTSDRQLRKGETVLIDVGCVLESYASDMTRTFPGSSPKMQHVNDVVINSSMAALKLCKAGVSGQQLDQAVRGVMRESEYELFFTHSLGHGIGLETHEYPTLSSKIGMEVILEEGMVVTIEPGLYLPHIGGVRHEDTILITKNGFENFYGDLV